MGQMKEVNYDLLKVKIFQNRPEMGANAASDVSQRIRELLTIQQNVNIIFASAPSQNEFLSSLVKESGIDWTRINAFHMDEYVGLKANAPQSFGQFLKDKIFEKVPFLNVYYLNGDAENTTSECRRYAQLLSNYPPDIVCMGIGENAHIAFNDPHMADFNDPVFVKEVTLDEVSRQQQVNDGCFENFDYVPTTAITLTVPVLLQAKNIYCIVPGFNKSRAVYHTINSDISEGFPSTVLRKHDNVNLYLDKESASRL